MRVAAVIPARYASQRLPGKPLADISGKPMVQRVYERAKMATCIDDVLIATDDERIARVVEEFGGKAVMTPADLQSGTDRIAFVARTLPGAEIVVNVQGDEPLLAPEMIDQAVAIVAYGNAVMGTLVKRIESEDELHNPNVVKVVLDNHGRCLYFSRSPIPHARDAGDNRWSSRHAYFKHIGLYVYRKDFLLKYASLEPGKLEHAEKLEQLRVLEHGYTIMAAITQHDSIPVDTPEDLERVRALFENT